MSTVPSSSASESDHRLSAFLFSGAAVAVGLAVQVSNGNLHPTAIRWLTLALLLSLAAVALPRVALFEKLGERPLVWLLGIGFTAELIKLLTNLPGIYLQPQQPDPFGHYYMGLAVAAVVAGSLFSGSPWLGRLGIPALLAAHFFLGVWLIKISPNPHIDVFVFQRDASLALLSGQNPYAITFPDIYGNSSPFYGEGLSVNGRLTFGFPYPPLSLLLALPGHLLAGDYRYAQLAAMTGSAALMAYARPGRVGAMVAAVFLFTPRNLFVLEQGWTEPYAVVLLAATVFAALRFPRFLFVPLGLLLVVKQYLVFAAPLAFLLLPREGRWKACVDLAWKAGAVGAAVTLPFVFWDVGAYVRDVVTLQLHQPFRADALSYLSWYAQAQGAPPPLGLAFVGVAVAVGLALWRARRTPAGFAGAVALAFLVFFAFNKQAFCNYYYFVIGALCCAAATARPDETL